MTLPKEEFFKVQKSIQQQSVWLSNSSLDHKILLKKYAMVFLQSLWAERHLKFQGEQQKRIKKKCTCVVTKKGTKDVYKAGLFLGKIIKQMKSVFIIFPCLVLSPFFINHQLSCCIISIWNFWLCYSMAWLGLSDS